MTESPYRTPALGPRFGPTLRDLRVASLAPAAGAAFAGAAAAAPALVRPPGAAGCPADHAAEHAFFDIAATGAR